MITRYFAIGDIHGHYDELMALLQKLQDEAGLDMVEDHLVLLGDLVDNGSQTRQVLEWCLRTKDRCPDTFHPLKGNHDDMMIDALRHHSQKYGDYSVWFDQGGKQTLESYSQHKKTQTFSIEPTDLIPKKHLDFLENLPTHLETPDYFFVHGGINPARALDDQEEDDLLWIREEFYSYPKTFPKTIVFAHTPFEKYNGTEFEFVPMLEEDRIGLNTMPRNEGHLTAIELPERKLFTQEKL